MGLATFSAWIDGGIDKYNSAETASDRVEEKSLRWEKHK
jgi:hypothetical protein